MIQMKLRIDEFLRRRRIVVHRWNMDGFCLFIAQTRMYRYKFTRASTRSLAIAHDATCWQQCARNCRGMMSSGTGTIDYTKASPRRWNTYAEAVLTLCSAAVRMSWIFLTKWNSLRRFHSNRKYFRTASVLARCYGEFRSRRAKKNKKLKKKNVRLRSAPATHDFVIKNCVGTRTHTHTSSEMNGKKIETRRLRPVISFILWLFAFPWHSRISLCTTVTFATCSTWRACGSVEAGK